MSSQVVKPEPKWEQVRRPGTAIILVGGITWFLLAFFWQVDDWGLFTWTPMLRFILFWGGVHVELVCMTLFMWLFCPTWRTRIGVLGIVLLIGNVIPQFVMIIADLAKTAGMSNLYMTGFGSELVIGFFLLMLITFIARPEDNF